MTSLRINLRLLPLIVLLLFSVPSLADTTNTNLNLSDTERAWLKSNTTVKFTGDPNWLPYEAFDSKGNYIGIVAEHLELINNMTGLKFIMSPSKTWTESTEKAKQGLVDILSETDDSDLKSHLNFTQPYISNPIIIAMHSRENYVESINHIKDKKIALIKDYGYASKIRRAYSNIDFITVDDIQDGLIAVSTGKVDALLCTLALCSYTIAELGLNNVKITGKTEFDTKLALGVQKNLPELLSILNKAINKIDLEQKNIILDRWIKIKFPEKTDYTLVFQISLAAIILILVFSLWVHRLTKEINLRITTEKELKSAEEASKLSHQRLLLHREHTPVGVIEWNTDFEFLDWNPAAERIFGYTKEEVLGHHITKRILPESARPAVDIVWENLLGNKGGTYSLNENTTKDGRTILCEWHNTPLIDQEGKVIGVTSLVDDVTERHKNEENLRHTQKMEAIGKLTGGIAHDFNNMLGVILGFSELLKNSLDKNTPKQEKYCNEILNAAERARKLTSKLLDFSRKDPSTSKITYINNLLLGMQHMLEKTLTHQIKLEFQLGDDLWPVTLDAARLEDAILNICINSMHAMPNGGTLTINTSNTNLTSTDVRQYDIPPGDYILLSISDTGTGMDQEIQQKIFDPFFTTKGVQGTGLGLSQVYGLIQHSGGKIQVYSEIDQGTRIVIYLPRLNESDASIKETDDQYSETLPSGTESILVVDDEVALLELTQEILTSHGYVVHLAENATEALNILEKTDIDLMLSDVVMPGINGYQLASEVTKLYPNVKIQIASGFTDKLNIDLNNEALHQQRLYKPYSSKELLGRIRELLDQD